jgi:glycerophosphoryl diester phosphodiesterase
MSVYDISGNVICSNNNNEYIVEASAHRGLSAEAPENTLPAFVLAKKKGFNIVETDVAFTADGVAVLLHDSTVDRTSNGTGNINTLTFEQVRAMDFGSWKGSKYAGTQIPTFEEFIALCKKISLQPYIEIKDNGTYTEAQVQSLVDVVRSYGMTDKVVWLSFYYTPYLQYVHAYEPNAKLLVNTTTITENVIQKAENLRGTNEVYIGASSYTDGEIELCKAANIPLVVGVFDTEDEILNIPPYIMGVTSNKLHAGEVLYNSIMSE